MKALWKMSAVVGMCISMHLSSMAATVPSSLPMIQSQDALRNYALGLCTFGTRTVSSPSIDWNWPKSFTYTNMSGAYAEQVLTKLFNVEFVYRVTNPADQISGYVYLYDRSPKGNNSPNLIFWGMVSYTADDIAAGNKPQYSIWMQDVPLPLTNVVSAEILVLGEDGKTVDTIAVTVRNGVPFIQSWYAGAPNGKLVIRQEEDQMYSYDLFNPVATEPALSREVAQYKINGHYVYPKGQKPLEVDITELWDLPTAIVEVSANQAITFNVRGLVQLNGRTEFERPTSWTFEQIDGPWAGAGSLFPDKPTQSSLPQAGTYRIKFEWTNFGKPNAIYTGPGGRG